jgi:hypothetical protein
LLVAHGLLVDFGEDALVALEVSLPDGLGKVSAQLLVAQQLELGV